MDDLKADRVMVTCKTSEIRRVRIFCRCGVASVAEIPPQTLAAVNLHTCRNCGRMFGIRFLVGEWKVAPLEGWIQDSMVVPVESES